MTAAAHAAALPARRAWLAPAALLAMLLAIAAVAAVTFGAVPVVLDDWLALTSGGELTGGSYVLWHIRLPRALFAILVGVALAMSGALTQGLFRNPLADPTLLGVSSGATCAAALTIVVLANLALPPSLRLWLLPLMAMLGAFTVCMALDRGARWLTPGSITGLLLAGMAFNAIAMAIVGLCTYLANDEQLRSLSFWTLGSLAGGGWMQCGILAVVVALALWRVKRLARTLNALALGEAAAAHVGVNVASLRTQLVLMVALLTGVAVAWSGLISFIGLVAPHIVRSWQGADQRVLVPLSGLLGALLMLVADTIARTAMIPAEAPVGIFTALLGAPVFLAMLRSARGRLA